MTLPGPTPAITRADMVRAPPVRGRISVVSAPVLTAEMTPTRPRLMGHDTVSVSET